ncbi:MAG: hypothetical protein AVDCRST_MAG07-329, partial [uncultured Frankineae bacterium]
GGRGARRAETSGAVALAPARRRRGARSAHRLRTGRLPAGARPPRRPAHAPGRRARRLRRRRAQRAGRPPVPAADAARGAGPPRRDGARPRRRPGPALRL